MFATVDILSDRYLEALLALRREPVSLQPLKLTTFCHQHVTVYENIDTHETRWLPSVLLCSHDPRIVWSLVGEKAAFDRNEIPTWRWIADAYYLVYMEAGTGRRRKMFWPDFDVVDAEAA